MCNGGEGGRGKKRNIKKEKELITAQKTET
jgi:hypothetical protein